MTQLALPLQLDDHAVFSSFLPAGNAGLVARLKAIADGDEIGGCWLYGARAVGKTHLLQAACAQAGDRAVYVPLRLYSELGAGALDGLASRELVCIDDVDAVAGDSDWEHALFALYNAAVAAGAQLVVTARATPRESGFSLSDLSSRMSQLPVYRVRPLKDDERAAALKLRASHRGLELPDDTVRYLLTRSARDMASLYSLLDTLDSASLRAQRRLTVPFVRDVLARS